MVEQYKRPYLDAATYIAWIKGETRDGIQCKPIIDHILSAAQIDVFRIGISTLIIAEVHKLRHGTALGADNDDRLISFFRHSFFDLIEVDRDIAEHANRLCRRFGIMPNDAIHLASALRIECDVLLTWDDRFARVTHPGIRCERPEIRVQVPPPEASDGG